MSKSQIHPTAIIADTATLGENVTVGPFAIIEDQVTLGDNCTIDAHAIVHAYTNMGDNNHVYPQAAIGGLPQDLGFDSSLVTTTEIGDNNSFREGVTISRGTAASGKTQIGSNCYFMNNAHVAHDCVVGDNNIFATSATLGGHVVVGSRVFFGGGAMVHQFCRVGSFAMIAGVIGIRKDVMPYTLVGGQPVKHYRLNTIGLRRAGISGDRYKALSQAFRCLKDSQPLDESIADTEEMSHLKDWLAEKSDRGIYGFASPNHDQ